MFKSNSVNGEALSNAVRSDIARAATAKQGCQTLGRLLQSALPRGKIDMHHSKTLAEALSPAHAQQPFRGCPSQPCASMPSHEGYTRA